MASVLFDDESLTLSARLAQHCRTRQYTLATAESCTGGLLAGLMTHAPGASDFFTHGYVVYANRAKEDTLAIDKQLVQEHGAVSSQVATAMARQAQRLAGSSLALSITGIAGPEGGTPDKPVGTVYVACAAAEVVEVHVRLLHLQGTRHTIRQQAIHAVLALALAHC
ncbi:MAG: CinA family protein [Alphaproteobacteria bacterium GM202ARS2]|nr:CinA family protein [Alphaproteobacteria bacterium GM202ARS2]